MISVLLLILIVLVLGGTIVQTLRGGSRSSDKELTEMRERMLRLEQSVETMAGEMDRLSEGQRFMTALLEDRPRAQASPKALPPGDAKSEE